MTNPKHQTKHETLKKNLRSKHIQNINEADGRHL